MATTDYGSFQWGSSWSAGGGGGGGGGGGANTTLSNLTDPVALNKSLLAGNGNINIGDDQGAALRDAFLINAVNDDAGLKAMDIANRALCDFQGQTVLVWDDSGEILIAPTNGVISVQGLIQPSQDVTYNFGNITQRIYLVYATGVDSGASPLTLGNMGATWTWAAADGTSGQSLVTDGDGNLSFETVVNKKIRTVSGDDILAPDVDYKIVFSALIPGSYSITLPPGENGLNFVSGKGALDTGTWTLIPDGADAIDSGLTAAFGLTAPTSMTFYDGTWYWI